MESFDGRATRRTVLRAAGGVGAVGLAGCPGDAASGGTDGTSTTDDERPEPERQLPTPLAGDPEAAVTVAVYADLGCPHCRTYALETEPEIWEEYVEPGAIRYEWHDFPIPVQETQSWLAADAARSVQANADSIDAFWEFTRVVYENQDDLSLDLYETLANGVGVDGETVRRETENRTYEPTVVASREAGLDRNVSGVPTVFANDNRMEGPSFEVIRNAIEDELDTA